VEAITANATRTIPTTIITTATIPVVKGLQRVAKDQMHLPVAVAEVVPNSNRGVKYKRQTKDKVVGQAVAVVGVLEQPVLPPDEEAVEVPQPVVVFLLERRPRAQCCLPQTQPRVNAHHHPCRREWCQPVHVDELRVTQTTRR